MEYNASQQPVFEAEFWRARLLDAYHYEQLHRAIYICTSEEWLSYKRKHERILNEVVSKQTSILDCGCGYGRLLTMLPENWEGGYLGIDLCQEFIDIAKGLYPNSEFIVGNLLYPVRTNRRFDIAVMISIKPMVLRNVGEEAWNTIEQNVREVADKILLLEYGEDYYELS